MSISETEASSIVKKGAGWVVGLGVLTVLLGMLAIGSPLFTGLAVETFVGTALLAGGIFQIVHAFQVGRKGSPFLWGLSGLLTVVYGVVLFSKPLQGLSLLTLLLCGYFIADGLVKIIHAFKYKPESGWGWMFVNGMVTLFLGLFIWKDWPLSGTWAIGTLFGVNLLLNGWTMIFAGNAVRGTMNAIGNTESDAK